MGLPIFGKKKFVKKPAQELDEIMALENSVERFERRMEFMAERFEEIRLKIGRIVLVQTKEADYYFQNLKIIMDEFKHITHAWGSSRDKNLQIAAKLFSDANKHAIGFQKATQAGNMHDAGAHRDLMNKNLNDLQNHIMILRKICLSLQNEEHDVLNSLKRADSDLKKSIETLMRTV